MNVSIERGQSSIQHQEQKVLNPSPAWRRFLAAGFLGMLTTAAVLLPSVACADPALFAPDYRGYVVAGSSSNPFTAPGHYALGGAAVDVVTFPEAAVSGHAEGNPDVGAGFLGQISYQFAVTGPYPDVPVPMFATFALHARAGDPSSSAGAGITIDSSGDIFGAGVSADGAHPTPADVFDTHPFIMLTGDIGEVSLEADAGSLGGLAEAFADPFLFIDPIFLASNPGYSVVVSPGIGNVAPVIAVPEPETYAMLLSGFGLLGFLTRRRRNTAARRPPKGRAWGRSVGGLPQTSSYDGEARNDKDIVMKNASPLRLWPVAALLLSATPVSALATVCPTATIDQILALGTCTIGDESFDFTHPQLPPHPVYFNGPFAGNTGLGPDASSVVFTPDATAGNPGFSLTADFVALGQASRNSSFYGGLVSGNFYDEQLAYFGVTAGAGEGLTGYSVALTGAHVTQGTGGSIVVDLNSASTVVNASGFTRASDSRAFAPSVVGQQLFASYLKTYEPSANPADSAGYASVSYHFSEALIAAAVPEPQTYALMFAGLAVVASVVRRRQRRG